MKKNICAVLLTSLLAISFGSCSHEDTPNDGVNPTDGNCNSGCSCMIVMVDCSIYNEDLSEELYSLDYNVSNQAPFSLSLDETYVIKYHLSAYNFYYEDVILSYDYTSIELTQYEEEQANKRSLYYYLKGLKVSDEEISLQLSVTQIYPMPTRLCSVVASLSLTTFSLESDEGGGEMEEQNEAIE